MNNRKMALCVDVMGFENDINEAIKACRDFVKKNQNVKIILSGNKDQIVKLLKSENEFEIIDAKDIISMEDDPLSSRTRKESSMYQAILAVKNNKADGVLSAGNTACYVFLTYLLLGKINGISKHAFMPYFPTRNNKGFNLLDVGANKDCDAKDLITFAKMGNIYAQSVRKIKNPTIAIANIGTEDNKGLERHIEANKILKQDKSINYVGFVEPRYLMEGVVDIVVADGFVGNIILKTLEGSAKTISRALKDELKKPAGWLGLLGFVAFKRLKNKFDYKNNAGAIVIGLEKVAVKTHGSADYKQFYSSLRMLKETVENDVVNKIKEQFNNEKNN